MTVREHRTVFCAKAILHLKPSHVAGLLAVLVCVAGAPASAQTGVDDGGSARC